MATLRRSPIRRTPSGKRLALTARDFEIFRALGRYRYLRSLHLHAIAGGASLTRFKERLGDLFHEGYIDRPLQQWAFTETRYAPAIYELGERARRLIAGEDVERRTFLGRQAHRQFLHAVAICDALSSIELATRTRPGLRFIPWMEILERAPESTRAAAIPFRVPLADGAVIPDALFGLEYQSPEKRAFRFCALEFDRGTMPVVRSDKRQTSLVGKLDAYRKLIDTNLHRSRLGIPNLLVLTLTTNCVRLERACAELGNTGRTFLFKAIDRQSLAAPFPDLLLEPWRRSGAPSLNLCEAIN